jgi:hypothetical protein
MGRVKPRVPARERENNLQNARNDYINGVEPSIRSAASTYGVPYATLRDRLQGVQSRVEAHQSEQILSVEEEESIVRFCEPLDDLGHPLKVKMVKVFAMSLLPPGRRRQLGKHWLIRFLNRNPSVTSKFSQRLDHQRTNADNPAILKDFYRKV